MSARRQVAVIGSGVSGLVAAHVLSRSDEVTLLEADDRFGGHAHTHDVDMGGRSVPVDTGFIVHNRRTYPTLLRLFAELGIATRETEMSMSIRSDADALEYAGGRGSSGLFPTWEVSRRPRYLRMLTEVTRFHRAARRLLETPEADGIGPSVGEFVALHKLSADFQRWFLTPLIAAVWSCEPDVALDYPARHLFRFLDHHGMLGVLGSPPWRVVAGGSRTYVEAVVAGLAHARTGARVEALREDADGVCLTLASGEELRFDAVVVATHADQALALLADPTPEQSRVLGVITSSRNVARLHTDTSLLPKAERARASWNYLIPPSRRAGEVVVTYDLTRLQHLPVVDGRRMLLTLGGEELIDPSKVIATMVYEHPLFTAESVGAQREVAHIGSARVSFAGAWQGWGFHEDGALSGLRAAERIGGSWDLPEAVTGQPGPVAPRLYETSIKHARTEPVDHRFGYSSYTWLVDLDDLPDHGPLGRFEARDHIGDPARSIRANLDTFLEAHGVTLQGGRILMLAQARVLGYCFNPISVFWCLHHDGSLAGVVVEVHNTYGDRHAYLVHPDEHGRADVDKELYVSPFNDVSGRYVLRVPMPGERVDVSVRLDRDGQAPFIATMTGNAVPSDPASVRRVLARHPWEPLLNSARIRKHGISLWARRLPVVRRPRHLPQAGTTSVNPERWPDVAATPTGVRAAVVGPMVGALLQQLSRRLGVRLVGPGEAAPTSSAAAPVLRVVRPREMTRRIARDGLIGFGESYLAGDWEADDLAGVLTRFAARMDSLVPKPVQRLRTAYLDGHPRDEQNSLDGARANISRHYDLSNELFKAFLDPSMTYSSALFAGDPRAAQWDDLEAAQHAKIDRLLDLAHVGEGTRVLEIGTGWGELAIRAARRGATVHSVTLSTEQETLARKRVALAGLESQVTIELKDYRQVRGQYDAVLSVEMIEAVGYEFLPTYFATIDRVLRPGGRAALQAITMADERVEATRHTWTWVHKYIFPGGFIPSVDLIERCLTTTDLRLVDDFGMGQSYAATLRLWDERFAAAAPTVRAIGFDDTFQRMWHFYLAYSQAGFASGYIDVRQLLFTKADA